MCECKENHEIVIINFKKCQVKGCFEQAYTYHFICKRDMKYLGFKRTFYVKFEDKKLCEKHFDQYALKGFENLFYKVEVLEVERVD